jgi:hypothetical protein
LPFLVRRMVLRSRPRETQEFAGRNMTEPREDEGLPVVIGAVVLDDLAERVELALLLV